MTNTIKSKFRRQFLFKLIFEFFFSLFFIILIFYLGYRWRGFQLDNSLMWLGVMLSIMLIVGFYQFFIYPLKSIEVTENEILVRFLIARREVQIPYSVIKTFRAVTIQSSFGASMVSGGTELRIILNNGDELHFNENEFANFQAIRKAIYAHWKKEHKL